MPRYRLKEDSVMVQLHLGDVDLGNGVSRPITRSEIALAGEEFDNLSPALLEIIEAGGQEDRWELVDPDAAAEDDEEKEQQNDEPFTPVGKTVAQVSEYLSGEGVTDDEIARVKALENEQAQPRPGIVNWEPKSS